ncbi:MAG: hypothetical protein GWO24_23295, partial [Akkermansiaceae bacterium]|nr:hypothetical protein [Akkermansiaceae bacterium]
HLLAALDRRKEANTLLEELAGAEDDRIKSEARLLHAFLLLEHGEFDAASALLPEMTAPDRKNRQAYQHYQHRRYLRARLALVRGQPAEAASRFRELSKSPEQLGSAVHHGTLVGLADALQASGQSEEGFEVLISFLDKHPRSQLLDGALARLLHWAQPNETLKNRLEEKLLMWSRAPRLAEFNQDTATSETAEPAQPQTFVPDAEAQRVGYALYYYSLFLTGKNGVDSNALAELLLERLRSEHPDHPLAPASFLETARVQNATDRREEAIATLTRL